VGDLVVRGWSGAAAALLRTLLDIQISAIAIINSRNPPLAAFRYFYSFHRAFARDGEYFDAESRRQARAEMRARITSLPKENQPSALKFIRERDRPYWFGEEFRNPAEVVKRFASNDMVRVYRQLSGAAHGSFLGMRLLTDVPDDRSVNPQLPVGDRAVSVALISSRMLVEVTSLRSTAEALGMAELCDVMRQEIRRNIPSSTLHNGG
jgi:hypothetical protein